MKEKTMKELIKVERWAFFLLTNARPVMAGDRVAFYQVQPHAIDRLREAVDGNDE